MIEWLKKKLGVVDLQQRVETLQDERKKLVEERNDLNEQLGVYRKREEADKAKYESKEPWVEIRSADFNEARGVRIELDWNDAFIEHLKESGIKGANEEEIVQKWLAFLYQNLIERLEAKAIDRKDEEKTISDYV